MLTPENRRNRQKTRSCCAARSKGEPYTNPGQVLGLLLVLVASACDTADTSPPSPASDPAAPPELVDMAAFNEAFEVLRELQLEETDEAMTVQPIVTLGGDGTFLLAEPMEGQVNVYGNDGRLRRVMGGRGQGPGEFMLPLRAHRTLDGGIVVADLQLARLTFFPVSGEDPEIVMSPITTVQGALDLGEDRYLLTGMLQSEGAPTLLHIWDRRAGDLERSFLPMGVPEESLGYALTFQGAFATLEADTIWAGWALSDTLYKFSRQGDRLEEIALPMVRPMGTLPRAGERVPDGDAGADAFDRFTQVLGVSVLDDGNLVVTSMQSRGTDAVWDLLIIDREGRQLLGAPNMPQLLAVEQDLFYFDDPASVLPNRWLVARWKGGLEP